MRIGLRRYQLALSIVVLVAFSGCGRVSPSTVTVVGEGVEAAIKVLPEDKIDEMIGAIIRNTPEDKIDELVISVLPHLPVDEIATAANNVSANVDGQMSGSLSALTVQFSEEDKILFRSAILDFSCGTVLGALSDGSLTWEEVRRQAAVSMAGMVANSLGEAWAADVVGVTTSTMDYLKDQSQGDPYRADRICRQLQP